MKGTKREDSEPVRLPKSTANRLRKVSQATGMSILHITNLAAVEWMDRHAPAHTVAGQAIAGVQDE